MPQADARQRGSMAAMFATALQRLATLTQLQISLAARKHDAATLFV